MANKLTLLLVVLCAIHVVLGDFGFPEADVEDKSKQNAEVKMMSLITNS